jgi:hypothetical protein
MPVGGISTERRSPSVAVGRSPSVAVGRGRSRSVGRRRSPSFDEASIGHVAAGRGRRHVGAVDAAYEHQPANWRRAAEIKHQSGGRSAG